MPTPKFRRTPEPPARRAGAPATEMLPAGTV